MSTTVDERVVEMRFDNRHFENNVQTSMSTLDKLKQSLNLTGAAKGMESIGQAAGRVDMSILGNAVDTVRMRFSALEVMAVTTLANITNSAVNAGKRMISALTIKPITTGFQEYETQINAVQTILANTESKGTTLDDVNSALDTLNTYADKTIYNFTQMTKNIGTFTAAGVDLDTSVKSIQGIANLAAVSGSTSQQASTAMYQLSQALAAGRVSLMDWNSVVNAGMGGQVFQDALKRTAKAMGTDVDAIIKKYGSFRESLTQGQWLTTEVLTKTLEQFTMAAEEGSEEWEKYKKSLMDEGYTEEQAVEILKMANTATDAATKVKTFTQLWDTLQEAAQSGWTQTWEIIVGDFEEAKTLLTNISNVVGDFINKTSQARNELLQGWKDAGGRADLIDAISASFEFLLTLIKPVTEAFREVFPALKVEHLTSITTGLKNFAENLKLSDSASENLKATFKGLFSILSIAGKLIGVVAKAVWELITSDGMAKLASFLLDIAAAIGDFFTKINEGLDTGGLTGVLSAIVGGLSDILGTSVTGISSFGDLLTAAGDILINVATKIWDVVKPVFEWFTNTFSVGDIFAGLAGGGIFVAAKKLSGLFDKIKEIFDGFLGKGKEKGESLKDKFSDVLGSMGDALNSFSSSVKIASVVSIAIAVGILAASLKTISGIDVGSVVKSLVAIGTMMGMLSWTLSSVTKSLSTYGSKGLIKTGVSLILIATAINILANAMEKIGGLPLDEVIKGLIGIGGGLAALSIALKIIGKTKISLSTSIAMLALAESCKILGDALLKFGQMTWEEIGRGLTAMGFALGELVLTLKLLDKVGGKSIFGSAALLIAVQSLDDIANALKKFGKMSWDEIKRGLVGMGFALGELSIALSYLGKTGGFSSIFASGAILIVVQGLDDIANALKKFGSMSWEEIKAGLVSMGFALGELAVSVGALGKLAGFSSILGAGAILIVTQSLDDIANALKKFGSMAWDEIGRGLAAMGGALLEVGVITGALGYLTGLAGIFGAGTIWIAVQGLDDLANALIKFGSMTWSEIGRGLVAMGAALLEVGVITGALGWVTGLAGLVGAGTLLLAVQGLDDLANALQKFGSMSWDEIGRGLTAMGAAMAEIAVGGVLNTISGLGALSISTIAEPLGVLADSVKKWVDVEIPVGLGTQLLVLAGGIQAFTFGGLGASALAEAAPAIGILADSVKKWIGLTVPEGLGNNIGSLAGGIKAFTWDGMGASALAEAAPAIGTLADSVKKWSSVTIPENMKTTLTGLADGVKAFSWAFLGGWSLDAIVGPLGELATDVKKWNGVKLPEKIDEKLTTLANGVKSFTWAFMGGWSIDAIVGPLGDLASSVKKWNGVKVSEGLSSGLKDLADGVSAFTTGIADISYASNVMDSLVSAIEDISGIDFSDANAKFKTAGEELMTQFMDGIGSKKTPCIEVITSLVSSVTDEFNTVYSKFYTAGDHAVQGFRDGIDENTWKAEAKAATMAKAALKAAEDELRIKSPSREFYSIGHYGVLGFVNALDDGISVAKKAGYNIADSARTGLSKAAAKIYNILGNDVDMTPTITPVLDLSNIKDGAGSISSMLGLGSSVGVLSNVNSINSRMNQNGQNGAEEVISAIDRLRKDLGKTGNTTYSINGITYDDGSNISTAVKDIVRAARIGRRV